MGHKFIILLVILLYPWELRPVRIRARIRPLVGDITRAATMAMYVNANQQHNSELRRFLENAS